MGKVTDKGDNLPPCFCLTSANWHVIYSRMSGGFFSSITALILTQTVLPIQEKNLPKSLFFFKAKRLNIHTYWNHILSLQWLSVIYKYSLVLQKAFWFFLLLLMPSLYELTVPINFHGTLSLLWEYKHLILPSICQAFLHKLNSMKSKEKEDEKFSPKVNKKYTW